MSNIKKVIGREYWTRVKKKSFIVMTLLAPFLIAAFYGAMIGIGFYSATAKGDIKNAILVNESPIISSIPDTMGELVITQKLDNFDTAIAMLRDNKTDVVLTIGKQQLFEEIQLGYYTEGGAESSQKGDFKSVVRKKVGDAKAKELGISEVQLDSLKADVVMTSKQVEEDGMKESNESIKGIVGIMFTMLIYIFIFMFAIQVMRGVMEEKTNRIVEVIISTVKPYELMFGKIVGIALVGLTQFLFWILLTIILLFVGNLVFAASMVDFNAITQAASDTSQAIPAELLDKNPKMFAVIGTLFAMPWLKIVFTFLSCFVGGYLLYGSIFAAIGSAVDSETDTQQFMFPITLPLILGIVIAQSAAFTNPDSSLVVWASMIPFTSPIVMMVRACFDAPWWEILLGVAILYLTFIVLVRFVGKIYRIGILTYGKKPSWKQLFKWVFSKQ